MTCIRIGLAPAPGLGGVVSRSANGAGWLIRSAELAGGSVADLRIREGLVREIAQGLAPISGESVVEANGGALLPGLHDHHLHLLALAAARDSIACGPPEVVDERALALALRGARAGASGWLRGVGYHERVAGALDRARLDALRSDLPLRVQHRSGALWVLNSAGVAVLGLDAGADAAGVERDARGRATGRLFRLDAWLRERSGSAVLPWLAETSRALARCGVTGVSDATPAYAPAALAHLARECTAGALSQRVYVMSAGAPSALARIALKLVLDERALPELAGFAGEIAAAHAEGLPVAIHCVTRTELWLALAALREAGARRGDRIEHASVAPPEALSLLAELGACVVTQPGFVATRGDDYLRDVEAADQPWLYRCAGFDAAGIALGAGTDAPYGDADPWRAMQAAVDRKTPLGAQLGAREAVTPERALALFTTAPDAPGGAPREVAIGSSADLCLLSGPWRVARERLSSELVAATWCAGEAILTQDRS